MFSFCDPPKAAGMTQPSMTQVCFVWSQVGRGPSQALFVISWDLWTMGGAPLLGVSLCLRPQCFSGSIFVTFWQDVISFHNPLNFSVCSLTNPLHTNIMLALGRRQLAVLPGLGMNVNPHRHTISCPSVLARVSWANQVLPGARMTCQRCVGPLHTESSRVLLLSCLTRQRLVSCLCMP